MKPFLGEVATAFWGLLSEHYDTTRDKCILIVVLNVLSNTVVLRGIKSTKTLANEFQKYVKPECAVHGYWNPNKGPYKTNHGAGYCNCKMTFKYKYLIQGFPWSMLNCV